MVNEPEDLPESLQGGDARIGNELRTFYIELLQETNLADYHRDREGYIKDRLSGTAAELLLSEAVVDLERHILAVTGSSRAKPLFVVSPPY